MIVVFLIFIFFFFNDTATTEIYTLSLHDALPIWVHTGQAKKSSTGNEATLFEADEDGQSLLHIFKEGRSEEHTSELQSQSNLVCRLLLEKKKKKHSQQYKNKSYTICTQTTLKSFK